MATYSNIYRFETLAEDGKLVAAEFALSPANLWDEPPYSGEVDFHEMYVDGVAGDHPDYQAEYAELEGQAWAMAQIPAHLWADSPLRGEPAWLYAPEDLDDCVLF